MLLISPSEAAIGIGAKCGGETPPDRDPQLLNILRYMLGRTEAALNVHSLVRGTFTDSYYLSAMPTYGERPKVQLLLSSGFIVPESITITDPNGKVTSGASVENANLDEGVVRLYSWFKGVWTVTYDSGFAVAPDPVELPDNWDPEQAVLEDVPDWLRAIVIEFLVVWYRTSFVNPKIPSVGKSGGSIYSQIDQLMRREMHARILAKYSRPRANVIFSEQLLRVA